MSSTKIGVIGLGYVGLPLARLFATKYNTVGFDINEERIIELNRGVDTTLEISDKLLQEVLKSENTEDIGLFCSTSIEDLHSCSVSY